MFYENNFLNFSIIYNSPWAPLDLPVLRLCPRQLWKNLCSSTALCKVMETWLQPLTSLPKTSRRSHLFGPGAPIHGLWKRNCLLVTTLVKVITEAKTSELYRVSKVIEFGLRIIFMAVFLFCFFCFWFFFALFDGTMSFFNLFRLLYLRKCFNSPHYIQDGTKDFRGSRCSFSHLTLLLFLTWPLVALYLLV